jgi:preprotein translocase subunit SecA
LRGYAQLDPLTEYKNEAFSMFEKLLNDVSFDFIRRIFQIKVTDESAVNEKMKTSAAEEAVYSAPSPINVFEQEKIADKLLIGVLPMALLTM